MAHDEKILKILALLDAIALHNTSKQTPELDFRHRKNGFGYQPHSFVGTTLSYHRKGRDKW